MNQPRKRGAEYSEEELRVIWDARENNIPPTPWLQLQNKYGFARDSAQRAYARMKAREGGEGAGEVPSAPVPMPASSPPPDWMTAFAEWAKLNNLPVGNLPITAAPESVQSIIHPPAIFTPAKFTKIAYISDVHLPFNDRVATEVMLRFLTNYKPDLILLAGDIWDFFEVSDYDRSPGRVTTLQDEFDEGRYFVKAIDEICQNIVFLAGNHEDRLTRLISKNPGLFKLRSLDIPRAAELPTHWRYYPPQTHYKLGEHLIALHGDLKGVRSATHPARTTFAKLKRSSIAGHWHRFSFHPDTDYDGKVRGSFTNGHLSDVSKVTSWVTCPDWQLGFSTIEMGASGLYAIRQHLIQNGYLIADGQEWSL